LTDTLPDLERRAIELVKHGDFGDEAVRVNAAITALAPANAAAWKRLGRCHLEQRQFDDAVTALRTALSLNPTDTIATNLLGEVRKQRALTPNAVERATTGFGAREFAVIGTHSPEEACRVLAPRLEALFTAVNASGVAERIVQARHRLGQSGSKVFQANSCHPGGAGHIQAFHHGGRSEPQFNIGWFSSPPLPSNCFRAGIGFNLAPAGREPDRAAGQERALAYFERFQQTLERAWKRELAQWMAANGGFIQYRDTPPATELTPERAVEWLLNCRNPASLDWVFVGRWLFLDRPEDAGILADRSKLARFVDDAFRTLFPLWLGAYSSDPH
jgi:tetratricopeptide (TPR) repeat protein